MSAIVRKAAKGLRLLRDRRFRGGLFKGVAATLEHRAALEPYRFSSVVDVGANRGQFTLLMAGLRPDAAILAFEPLIEPYRKLIEVTAGFSNVRAFHSAIGPERASVAMNVANQDDSSSILPITGLQEQIFPNTGHQRTVDVRMAPLGDFLEGQQMARPSLLKIDVQGYELEVLKGSREYLDRFDVLYVEASFLELYEGQPLAHDVIAALGAERFHLAAIHNLVNAPDGRAVQADFLFERR
ncbi:MAG: FkbM family methyltransferase [Geminicoccaceae bacterium]